MTLILTHYNVIYNQFMARILAVFFVLLYYASFAQNDTIQKVEAKIKQAEVKIEKEPKEHSPRKATIYSAVLPGLGQAYNKSYWKIPVIYAGLGVTGYFIYQNNKKYKDYKDAYVYKAQENPEGEPPNDYAIIYNVEQLKSAKEYYLRNLELSYIATAAIYLLNIVEARVDAQFFNYDVDEDLSLQLYPQMQTGYLFQSQYPALTLQLNF